MRPWRWYLLGMILTLGLGACAAPSQKPEIMAPGPPPQQQQPPQPQPSKVLTGTASWYGENHHGKLNANGERFDMNAMTAAHRTLPFGTRLRVVNLNNDREVEVRINDRGPFVPGRILDLSYGAARAVGALGAGTFPVRATVLPPLAAFAPAADLAVPADH